MDEKKEHGATNWINWAVIAVAAVLSTSIAALTWQRVKTRDVNVISITGSAKKRIVSDLIVWKAQLTTQEPERTAAYRALRGHVEKTMAYLKQQGIKESEIRAGSVVTSPLHETEVVGSGDNRVERRVFRGFETRQEITVQSADVQRVERVSREVTQLIANGVPITSEAPAYLYTKLGELKIEMLAEAAKDARTRADRVLSSAGGGKVRKLQSADMGVINVNRANSTETSWQGNNDTTSLEKDIITVVRCSYSIE